MSKFLSVIVLALFAIFQSVQVSAQTQKNNTKNNSKQLNSQKKPVDLSIQVDSLLRLGIDKEEIVRQLAKNKSPNEKKQLAASLRNTPRHQVSTGNNTSANQPAPPASMTAEEIADAAEILRCFSPHTVTGNIDEGLITMIVEEFQIPSLDFLFQVMDAGNYMTNYQNIIQHINLVTRWLQGGTGTSTTTPPSGAFRIPNWSDQFDAIIALWHQKNLEPGALLQPILGTTTGAVGLPAQFNVFLASTRDERVNQLLPMIQSTYGINELMFLRTTIEYLSIGSRDVNRLRPGIRSFRVIVGSGFQRTPEYWAQVFKLQNISDRNGNEYQPVTSAEATTYLIEMGFTNAQVLSAIRTVYQN